MNHSRNAIAAFLLATLSLAYACKTADPSAADRVTLSERQSARLASGVTVQVDTIADSRCPKDVQCIWEGNAFVSALLTKDQTSARVRLILGPDITQKMRRDLDSTGVFLGSEPYKVILRSVSDNKRAVVQVTRL